MKILVVVDAQNDFIDGALHNEEAIKAVPRIVEKIKNWDRGIVAFHSGNESVFFPGEKEIALNSINNR